MAISVPGPQPYRVDWTRAGSLDEINDRLATAFSNLDEMLDQLYTRPTIAIDDSGTSSSSGSSLPDPVTVPHGGTGLATVAQGDILYGSATDTIAALAKDANAKRYLSNTGTSNNPAWAQVDLTNGVTGVLPIANGGTGGSTASAARTALGLAIGSNIQAWDTDLDGLAAVSANGMISRTASGTFAARTISAGSGISVTNGDGVSGNPTIALTSGLAAGFQIVTILLLDADIRGLGTTPITLIAAPGAGKAILPYALNASRNWVATYSGSTTWGLRFLGNGTNTVSFSFTNSIAVATIFGVCVSSTTTSEGVQVANTALTVRSSANVTGGNAANTVKITIVYAIVDVA